MYTYKGTIEIACNWCQREQIFTAKDKTLSDDNFIKIVEEMLLSDIMNYCEDCGEETEWSVSNYEMPKIEIIE